MALVSGPLHSGQATGSVEGMVYSEDGYGTATRARITCNVHRSDVLSAQKRAVFSQVVYHWANLSEVSYNLWVTWLGERMAINKLGGSYRPSIKQIFTEINCRRLTYWPTYYQQNFPITSDNGLDFPPNTANQWLPNFSLEWTVNGAQLSWSESIPDDAAIAVWEIRNLKATQILAKNWRLAYVIKTPYDTPQLITGAIIEPNVPYGWPIIVGNRYLNVRIKVIMSNGLASPAITMRLLCQN